MCTIAHKRRIKESTMQRILFSVVLMLILAASTFAAEGDNNSFRRFDIHVNPISYAHIEGVNAWGSQFGFTAKFNKHVGIVADFDGHRNNTGSTTDLFAYR